MRVRVKVGVRSGLGSVSVRVTCTVRAMVRARTRVGPGMVRGRVGREQRCIQIRTRTGGVDSH